MPKFSGTSLAHLRTADARLQSLAHKVIEHMDHTILCAHRGQKEQDLAFSTGKSKVRWPNSKHNSLPAKAIDVAPYPIDWNDTHRFARLMGHYERVANEQGIKIRLGMDFSGDGRTVDERFLDFPHIELVE